METTQILMILIGAGLGFAALTLLAGKGQKGKEEATRLKAKEVLDEAKKEAKMIREEAKAKLEDLKVAAQEENLLMEESLSRVKESLEMKQKHVQSRQDKNKNMQDQVDEMKKEIQSFEESMKNDTEAIVDELLKKTGKKRENILQEVQTELANEILNRKDRYVQSRAQEIEEDSTKIAQEVLTVALQKYCDTSSVDRTETAVLVKNEHFKPEFIGPKGEFIERFEELTDVEVIFNDYPKTITIGGYSVLKRQIGRHSIEWLQRSKGRITMEKVEQAVAEGERAVKTMMRKEAVNACKKMGLKDVPEGLLDYVGRLHLRTSYGQNALKHCLEVGYFAGILAAEIGADIEVARLAGFFHDVGKAISEESDKGHDYLTKDILEEFDYPEEIIHAAWVHHEAEPAKTLEAKIVMAADALSASRPGARLESLERYLKRIRELESTAGSFPGIKNTFAISAGREVRVIVRPEEVTDQMMAELAHDIAQKIENELTYPGNVKVNLIRRQKWKAIASQKNKSKTSKN